MSDKPVIAIDGTAASGKGTLARRVAQKLDYAYLDTGILYRLVAWRMIENDCTADDTISALRFAQVLRRTFSLQDSDRPELRTEAVSSMTSKIATYADVREELLELQRDFGVNPPALADGNKAQGAVLDGRDIGTVVCPDATIKFFVNAKTETRAMRRFKELQSKGFPDTYDTVLAEMRTRDERDTGRETAPLKPAPDAVILDTTAMSVDQVLTFALSRIREKLKS